MSISFHSWMLSNESISGTEKVSLLFCFSINCVMTILFYLIFSVGIWCPEGDSTPSLIIYIYTQINYIIASKNMLMIYIIIIINNELLAYDKHNNYIVIDNFLSDCAQLANTSVQKQTQLVYSQLSLIHFTILAYIFYL